jgi:peroxiredoxin
MTLIIFGSVLPWLLVGVGCWLGVLLVRQYGRILLRLDAMEKRLGRAAAPPRPSGLPVGSVAPDFELPDLAGARHTLAQFRGRRVLLIFSNPGCGFCVRMMPALAALPPEGGDGRPVPLVVTGGDAEANRRLLQEHAVRCPVLLQEKGEVAARYQARGTPTGYVIDEEGKIVSELTVGADALLALAVPNASPAAKEEDCGCGKKARGKANKGLAASRLNRDGLKAGTPAPDFRLPRLDGGEWSPEEARGRRLLLVFSDPGCGPCERLAPYLEQLHRQRPDLQVVLVSRGDVEANRRKVEQLGLTFPVVLQKSWEVSRLYAMFATPIAYLIDEQGVIAADVVKGVEPILALAAGVTMPGSPRAEAERNGQELAAQSA